jgi:predicted Zn finger-like uncharacterized protein
MKFTCDKCNTRYSIADERVRGRVLKIRCKACNNVITVREELPPAENLEDAIANYAADDEHTRVSTAPPPGLEGIDDWYVSFDGEQEGPLGIERAIERVRMERPRGKECFCWRAGFFVWLPVDDVPEFAPALVKLPPLPLPAPSRATGPQAALRGSRSTGQQPAVRATRSTGPQAAVRSPTGPAHAIVEPHAHRPMPASRPIAELPAIESDPLLGSAPNVSIPLVPTKPESRSARKSDAVPLLSDADSGPIVSPFRAALQASGPTMAGGAPPRDGPRLEAPIPDSGPVPLPPPPGDDLPIDEPSGMVSLSRLSKPALASPKTGPKPLVETFGGQVVTPSVPTPGPHAVVVIPGAARGTPSWMKWAALGGGVATIGLAVAVVVLMTRKPTVIVVPPAPTLDDGKHVDDKPITIADPGQPGGPIQPLSASDAKRAQKRPPSSARAAASVKPPVDSKDSLSNTQRNLASLYRGDTGGEHGVKPGSATASDGAHGVPQVSQQAIMAVVTQNRRSLNLCYDRVLKHDNSLKSGRVLTHVKVGISGSVTGVNVPDPQYANSEIGQCIATTIKHWHFPSADAEYETEFPIILQAN